MTAREIWRHWYRTLRVLRREHLKAERDMMLFGTGIVVLPTDGDPHHVPVDQWCEEYGNYILHSRIDL